MKSKHSPWKVWLLSSVLLFLVISAVRLIGGWETIELESYDWLIREVAHPVPIHEDIVIVGVTESDLEKYGYPLSDALLARGLDQLVAARASVIGVDIYRDKAVEPGHNNLVDVISGHHNIIWITKIGSRTVRTISPPPILNDRPSQVGFNDIVTDRQGIVRRGLLYMDDGEQLYTSFSLQLALKHLESEGISPKSAPENPDYLLLGAGVLAPLSSNFGGYIDIDNAGYQFSLDYGGMPNRYPRFSLDQLLSGKLGDGRLQDKVVIVGGTALSTNDFHHTPYSQALEAEIPIYGVELHAFILGQILRISDGSSVAMNSPEEWLELAMILLLALFGGYVGIRFQNIYVLFIFTLVGGGAIFLACSLAFRANWWLPLVPFLMSFLSAIILMTAYDLSEEKWHRMFLYQAFGKYVSPVIIDHMLDHPDELKLGGDRRVVTFLFTDIANFTSLTEATSPQLLVSMLKGYFAGMCGVVFKYKGTIDRFVGDSLVVMFNAPVTMENHEEVAVQCAMDMDAFAQKFAEEIRLQGIELGVTRIGINTGEVVVGNYGSERFYHYTAMGDPINTAARMESANKQLGTRICVSETTVQGCDHIEFRPIGRITYVGKKIPVKTFEPIFSGSPSEHGLVEYLKAYALLEQSHEQALNAFGCLLMEYPDDSLLQLHYDRLSKGESGENIILDKK